MDETILESQETVEETGDIFSTVSGSDALTDAPALTVEDIAVGIEAAQPLQVVTVSAGDTLFTKPLEEYTVTEGLLLILVLCVVGLCITKVIGGILNCKFLFHK